MRQLHVLSGHSLAAWLNEKKPEISNAQSVIAASVRGLRPGAPPVRDALTTRLVRARARVYTKSGAIHFDLVGFSDWDYAVLLLRDICQAGALDRLRECPHCKIWFFAEDWRQKFSGPSCRSNWFTAHNGRERAALHNRRWRINNVHLPAVENRISRLESLKRAPTKAECVRLERARRRQERLQRELRQLEARLKGR